MKIIFGRYCNITPICDDVAPYCRHLPVKPLSSISDEDGKLFGYIDKKYYSQDWSDFDTFRQLGYATPQTVIENGKVVTYRVEELVELGIYKLI